MLGQRQKHASVPRCLAGAQNVVVTDFLARAGKLAVASDEDGSIASAYDLDVREGRAGMKDTRGEEIGHGFAERTTFIVTPDGKIAETIGGISPMENVQKSLEAVQRLQ